MGVLIAVIVFLAVLVAVVMISGKRSRYDGSGDADTDLQVARSHMDRQRQNGTTFGGPPLF